MNVMVCVDDRGGLLFNHRRQSQDAVLREKVLELSAGHGLWMGEYSAKQFAGASVSVDNDFLSQAPEGDFCFAECGGLSAFESRMEHLILFRWNRHYPADTYLDLDLTRWKLQRGEHFAGKSHEKITMEVYTK